MAVDITVRQGAAGNPVEAKTAVHIEVTDADRAVLAPDAVAITSSSVANPTEILTGAAHGLTTGDTVWIEGHTSATPAIQGEYEVTVVDADQFTIPVNVTDGGTGGTVQRISAGADGRVPGEEIRYYLLIDAPAGVDDAKSVIFSPNADGDWTWDGYIFPADGSYTIRLIDSFDDSEVTTQAVTVAAA